MLSGIGPASHLAEVGVGPEGGPRRGRREPAGPPRGAAALAHPRHHRPGPAQQRAQLRSLEGPGHRSARLQHRRGGRVLRQPRRARRRRTCRSTWRRRASTTTGCTSRPARWSPRRRRWSRSPAAATCGSGRRTRPGTRRSRRRTSTTRPTSTRCSPGCAAPGRSAPRARSRRTSTGRGSCPDRPTDEDFVEHARTWAQTLYHPTSTCAMGSGEDAVVDPDAAGPRRRGAARRRRVRHARRRPRQHQRPDDHDRREGRRPHQGAAMTATEARPHDVRVARPAHRRRRRHPPGAHRGGGAGRGRPGPRGGGLVGRALLRRARDGTCRPGRAR